MRGSRLELSSDRQALVPTVHAKGGSMFACGGATDNELFLRWLM